MKKYFKYISAFALVVTVAMSLASCSEKSLDETIFPDVTDELDPNSYTYKFDKWLKENYLDVYNLEFQYKLKDTETDMTYNLVPATLSKSIDLAVLAKYMWFDVYEEVTGSKEFVKTYGPRILMLIGSPAINPTQNTIVLGLAEGGIKISLLNVNRINPYNMEDLNGEGSPFQTMHHEFAHILHQTKSIPREFQLLSLGHFDAMNWQKRNKGLVHSLGFITQYASSEIREDFAETIANYITMPQDTLDRVFVEAARGYTTKSSGEGEEDMLDLDYFCFYYYNDNQAGDENRQYIEEEKTDTLENGTRILTGEYQKGINPVKGEDGKWYDENGNLCDDSANHYLLDKNGEKIPIYVYPVEDSDGVDGVAILTQKINICRNWFKEQWNIDLDELRRVVQERMSTYNASVLNTLRQQVYDME